MSRRWHELSIETLIQLIQEPPTMVDAELALCEIGDRIRLRELNTIDRDLQDLIAEHLKAPDLVVQLEAAIVLAELKDPRAADVLVRAAAKRPLRLEALRAMGKLKTPTIETCLQGYLGRFWGHWADKLQAAASLAQQGDQDALDYLKKRCQSRRSLERCSALEFLGESRHPDAFPFLINYLEDTSRPEWLSAARGLAMHRSSDAKNRLKSALNSVDSEVRESVMHWLSERHLSLDTESQSKEVG